MSARIGRRGAFLSLFAIVYAIIGYSYLLTPTTPLVRKALRLALDLLPLRAWGVLWLVAAAIMLLSAGLRTGRDWLGFVVAMLLPAWWAVMYFLAWLHADLPRGWLSSAVYAALAGAVGVVAGWPEPGGRR